MAAHIGRIRHRMKKAPNHRFLLGALALSLAALFTGCQSTPARTAAELKPLQGYWEGFLLGATNFKCSITITGNSLYHYARTDFWQKATFTLPAGTEPKQLRATIKDAPQPNDIIGAVVVAIYKIEDGTLTLALNQEDPERLPPKTFPSDDTWPFSSYVLKKVQLQPKNTQPPKTQ